MWIAEQIGARAGAGEVSIGSASFPLCSCWLHAEGHHSNGGGTYGVDVISS